MIKCNVVQTILIPVGSVARLGVRSFRLMTRKCVTPAVQLVLLLYTSWTRISTFAVYWHRVSINWYFVVLFTFPYLMFSMICIFWVQNRVVEIFLLACSRGYTRLIGGRAKRKLLPTYVDKDVTNLSIICKVMKFIMTEHENFEKPRANQNPNTRRVCIHLEMPRDGSTL